MRLPVTLAVFSLLLVGMHRGGHSRKITCACARQLCQCHRLDEKQANMRKRQKQNRKRQACSSAK
jgi:hypothetical protein